MKSLGILLSTAAVTVIMPSVGHAQTSPPASPPSASPGPPVTTSPDVGASAVADTTPTAQDAGPAEGNDIVVTASRRSERLKDVPTAITAFSSEQLRTFHVENTRDLSFVTPGFTLQQGTFSPQPTIRSVGTKGTGAGDEQVVPIYIDGIYQSFVSGSFFELSNVERIEVLKGPQGILFGRNATGGAINIITNTPTEDFKGNLSLSYGSYDQRRIKGYVSGGTEKIAADLAATYAADNGFIRDLVHGGKTGDTLSAAVRGKVVLTPTERTSIMFSAAYSYLRDYQNSAVFPIGGSTSARTGNPGLVTPTGRLEVALSPEFQPQFRLRQTALGLRIVQHFGAADLTSVTGFQRNRAYVHSDSDAAVPLRAYLNYFPRQRGINEEIYLTSTGKTRFKWILGAFYFHETSNQEDYVNSGAPPIQNDVTTDAYAVYAQGSYEITDRLNLTAGLRYSHDNKKLFAQRQGGAAIRGDNDWESTDPSVSLTYKASSDVNIYAKYGSAYKSGVYNGTSLINTPANPERLDQYEVGIKTTPLHNVSFNAAAYYTDYTGLQFAARDPVTNQNITTNAGSARVYGGEAELNARLGKGFALGLGLSYSHATFTEFPFAVTYDPKPDRTGNVAVIRDVKGNHIMKSPELTANINASYTVPVAGGNLQLSGVGYYTSEYYWDAANRVRTPHHAIVNSQISWAPAGDRYRVSLFVDNLTNIVYYQTVSISANADLAAYSRPRYVGAKVEFNFR